MLHEQASTEGDAMTEQQLQQYHAMHRHTQNITNTADARARRAARKCGLRVCKSRQQRHMNNYGGYQLIDGRNCVVAGVNFELNADDVVELCKERAGR
jgi:hypothetical protein